MKMLQRLGRLWLNGFLLGIFIWFIQLIIALPFLAISKHRLEALPSVLGITVAVVFLLGYSPIAFGWVFSNLIKRTGVVRAVMKSMLQESEVMPVPSEGYQSSHIPPFVLLGFFNVGVAIALNLISALSTHLFERALQKPVALPLLTSFMIRTNWWPWAIVALCFISILIILAGKLRGRALFNTFAALCLIDGILLLCSFVGFWSPLLKIANDLCP